MYPFAASQRCRLAVSDVAARPTSRSRPSRKGGGLLSPGGALISVRGECFEKHQKENVMAESAVEAAVSGESAMDRLDRILADYGFSTDSQSPRQYFLVSTVKENAEPGVLEERD